MGSSEAESWWGHTNKKTAFLAVFLLVFFTRDSNLPEYYILPTMWVTYILRCRGGRLYTGMTNNLATRLLAHNAGTGGAFTRAMRPCSLIWHQHQPNRSKAQKEEAWIKKMPRPQKDAIIAEGGCEQCPEM